MMEREAERVGEGERDLTGVGGQRGATWLVQRIIYIHSLSLYREKNLNIYVHI